jgi:hypothetical protein
MKDAEAGGGSISPFPPVLDLGVLATDQLLHQDKWMQKTS